MEADVQVALIAAGASMVVAIVSLVATLISSLSTNKTARALEKMKLDYAREARGDEIDDDEFVKCLDALLDALESIQHMKDDMVTIKEAVGDSLSAEEAMTIIAAARDRVLGCHAEGHGRLSGPERRAYHIAKGTAVQIERVFRLALTDCQHASELPEVSRGEIKDLRDRLSEYQQVLRDSRMDRLANRRRSGP